MFILLPSDNSYQLDLIFFKSFMTVFSEHFLIVADDIWIVVSYLTAVFVNFLVKTYFTVVQSLLWTLRLLNRLDLKKFGH